MASCETYRALMLDFVYDLIEGSERDELQAHLQSCPVCQQELGHARHQQQLLAAAARMEFPTVRFQAPASSGVTTTPVAARTAPPRRTARRLLAAAAILLAIVGLGVPVALEGKVYLDSKQLVQDQKTRIDQKRQALARTQQEIAQLPQKQMERLTAIQQEIQQRQMNVTVVGPSHVQSGAPANYRVLTRDAAGSPTPATIKAQLKEGDRPVDKPIDVVAGPPGVYQITLPPDLPIRPGSKPVLVVSARKEGGSEAELSETLELAGPVYSTFLTIDKPMYNPGETVYFRSLTLDRSTLQPPTEDMLLQYVLTLPIGSQQALAQGSSTLTSSPGGPQLQGPDGKPLRGIGAGEYPIPPDAPQGEYTLTVRDLGQRFPEQKRKFVVNKYQAPRLNKELDFNRKTYGPGDEVQALCKAVSADKGPLKNRPVYAVVQIDGQTYDANGQPSGQQLRFQTNDQGKVVVRFKLPAAIARGLGSLQVTFDDGGSPETMVRPLPIVLKKLDVEMYPEGGDLAAGLKSRVYFQVRTTLSKPADLKGEVLEDGKPMGVTVETLHDDREPGVNQGMGVFELTPRTGHKYELRIDSPVGIAQRPVLPAVAKEGVVLSVPEGATGDDPSIPVIVRSTGKQDFLVGLYCRGRLLDSAQLEPVHFNKGEARALLKPTHGGGVCRVTVFALDKVDGHRQKLRPVAERLVYRRPTEQLKLKLQPDRKGYVPRQQVQLKVEAVDEKDRPAPAVVMLAVVDESIVKLADDKTLRSMPTHFLLTSEVRQPDELEYADFLVGPQKKAAAALDLLLGTQGWRRFAEQNPELFRQRHKEEAERLLVTIGQSDNQATDFDQKRLEAVQEETVHKQQELNTQVAQGEQELHQAERDDSYQAAIATLAGFDKLFDDTRHWGGPFLGVVLLAVALACIIAAVKQRARNALPYIGMLAGAFGLALLVWTQVLDTQQKKQFQSAALNESAAHGRQVAQAERAAQKMAGAMPPADARPMAEPAAPPDAAVNRAEGLGMQNAPAGEGKARGGAMPPAPGAVAPAMVPPPPGPGAPPNAVPQGLKPGMAPAFRLDPRAREQALPQQQMGRAGAFKEGNGARAFGGPMAKRGIGPAGGPMPGMGPMAPMAPMAPMPGMPQLPGGMAGGMMGGMPQMGGMPGPAAMMDRADGAQPWNGRMAFRRNLPAPYAPPLVVRQYAHTWKGSNPNERTDNAETLYWHPALVLPGGKTEISFQLCDSTTRFQMTAFAHTLDGRLGSLTQSIESRLPLTVKASTPVEVTSSDRIEVPVNVSNNSTESRKVLLSLQKHKGLALLESPEHVELTVPADTTMRRGYRFRPTLTEGAADLTLTARAEGASEDTITTKFRVVPEGFPVVASHSDVLEASASHALTLPQTWIKGTLKCQLQVYPSTLASLQEGLAGLLREPNGCFEQTSSSNYPNLLILDYLRENRQAKPEVERQARDLLARGYTKLVSFECVAPSENNKRGYEWFGGAAPPHEALTAYGLMEFRDMARVFDVDPAMLERTRTYLLSQRDGKGGFKRNPRALDSFGRAPDAITNAYIVWSLTEGGKDDDLRVELDALAEQAKTSKDPYFLSLVANSFINRARTAEAVKLLETVAGKQQDDGHLDAEQTSITGSGGRDLQIETTALAVLGWLKANPGKFNGQVQKAVRWIGQQRGGYGAFGSTQSTILALKALLAFTKANQRMAEAGELKLYVGDREVAQKKFAAGASDTLVLDIPEADKVLQPGRNRLRAEITGKNTFPYTLSWSYQTLQPASADKCPVRIKAGLARKAVAEGDTVRLTVQVENASGTGQGMAVAIIGLPGGLIVPEDLKQLKEYIRVPRDGEKPLLGAFELRGRELILYWRDLAPQQKIEVPIDLIARIPGEYSGPASRGYLYYNADHKHWIAPLQVKITERGK
jgi:hypothetical protein